MDNIFSNMPSEPTQPPLISIITVVLNAVETIEKSILSVIGQDFKEYEYIIVDGKSNDGTKEVIQKYSNHITFWVSEQDNGIYNAMNKGISTARGAFIYFLGADDILLDSALRLSARYLKDDKSVYYGNVYRQFADRIYDGEFNSYKLACRNICQQAIFYPKSVFLKYKFNEKYRYLADYELNIRCFSDKDFRFTHIPEVICEFNDFNGKSVNSDENFECDRMEIVKSNFPYRIYTLIKIRFWFISKLEKVNLLKLSRVAYHRFLRMRNSKNY